MIGDRSPLGRLGNIWPPCLDAVRLADYHAAAVVFKRWVLRTSDISSQGTNLGMGMVEGLTDQAGKLLLGEFEVLLDARACILRCDVVHPVSAVLSNIGRDVCAG